MVVKIYDDIKYQTTPKLHQKQFNILNIEYSTRNNKLRRSLFGHRIRQNKFRDLLILMAIISQKQILAIVNSLKVVEIVFPKMLKLPLVLAPLPTSRMEENTCFVSLTF